MRALFATIWALILLVPQITVHVAPFGIPLGLGLITILVIFVGFEFPAGRGLVAVTIISFMAEVFSRMVHGHIILSHLILFFFIQVVMDKIYTEAYLTKCFWVFIFSITHLLFVGFVLSPNFVELDLGTTLLQILLQSLVNGVVSFPLLILFDTTFSFWSSASSRRKKSVTGADWFAAKSSQRKYIK
ncbi:hypothetical protein K1X76_04380 [bacterium]|nr:hypothetical protein [bacterium]